MIERHGQSPDVTDRVMERLGYRRVESPAARRSLRVRRSLAVAAKAVAVLAACAAATAWWCRTGETAPSQPVVGDALRGSVVQGAGRLDALLLGMPRAPRTSPLDAADAPRVADAPAGESSPHVRSY